MIASSFTGGHSSRISRLDWLTVFIVLQKGTVLFKLLSELSSVLSKYNGAFSEIFSKMCLTNRKYSVLS
jgi:hypothetical protein